MLVSLPWTDNRFVPKDRSNQPNQHQIETDVQEAHKTRFRLVFERDCLYDWLIVKEGKREHELAIDGSKQGRCCVRAIFAKTEFVELSKAANESL